MKRISLIALVLLAGASLAAEESPYAGQELRSIKSLSPQEAESLRSGRGMGLAKLAELNHYPGPRHVLDLADELELTPTQLAKTEDIYKRMHDSAVMYGEQLIEAEIELNGRFEDGTIDAESLEDALLRIGEIRSRLRNVHLQAHLDQKRVLTAAQITAYDEIRGYRQSASDHSGHHKGHH